MFNFFVDETSDYDAGRHTLIYVCQSWRCVVFASPRRLNLRRLCTPKWPLKNMLDVWPALPIAIEARGTRSTWPGTDNIVSALERHDRMYKIVMMGIPNSLLTTFAVMKDPFPALTFLGLAAYDENPPGLPDSFLVRSAERLRVLDLQNILGKLLLATSDLVQLRLWRIPHSGYISPEAMATALSALTTLEELVLHFQSPQSQTDGESRRLLPSTRVVLPALTDFRFKGDSEYLEDIVSRALYSTTAISPSSIERYSTLHYCTTSSVARRHSKHPIELTSTFPAKAYIAASLSEVGWLITTYCGWESYANRQIGRFHL
jgi:hypothetical protein